MALAIRTRQMILASAAHAKGGGVKLVNPRIGLVGPSTVEYNHYGAINNSVYRNYGLASGPFTWALMRDRRAQILIEPKATGNFIAGDNQGVGGVGGSAYPAQIAAIKTRFAGVPTNKRMIYYDPGRNDLTDGHDLAYYQTFINRDVADMKAFGFAKILIGMLFNRDPAYGPPWEEGGVARATLAQINNWMTATFGADPDIKLIDFPSALIDPGTGNPLPGTMRSDYTHLTAKGGDFASVAVSAALAELCDAVPYPAPGADNLIAPLSGTGGSKTSVTGTVFDDWTAALTVNTTASVVASQVVLDGKSFQRFDISNTTSVPSGGAQLAFTKTTPIAVPANKKIGQRMRVKIPATNVPYMLFALLGTSGFSGIPTAARSHAIASIIDETANTPVEAAGTNFSGGFKFDGTKDMDLWIETPNFVQADVAGSSIGLALRLFFGNGGAGATLRLDVGEIQTFDWPT
ncbi:SGNH/GDSL hydrolase family protein [Rhizobium sp. GCM10022189]|uniref:SGNH/GDSL hydrolase family protein n=1 Tax=Rhizobium sp. GCM10022189 TaxID=3252654 RepID=UPI00361860E3